MSDTNEPRVIKRYRNRKLYDTVDSCYVTLEDIADYVRNEINVKVIDSATGKDMTSITFAQVILEEEKRQSDFLPLATLANLIKTGGEAVKSFVERSVVPAVKEGDNTLLVNIKRFVEDRIRPTVESVQNIPAVKAEMDKLRSKLESIERHMHARPATKARPKKAKKK